MVVQPPTAAAAPLPRAAGSGVSAEPGPHGARPAMARVGTHWAAPPVELGDATAQQLDAVVAASAARLSGWVMQLPTGAVAPHAPREQHCPEEAGHQAMATAYNTFWDKQLEADKNTADQDKDTNRHPGREWRRGDGLAAASAAGLQGGPAPRLYRTQLTVDPPEEHKVGRSSKHRVKAQTERAAGEKWPHPGDVGELRPGVSASVIHPAGAPHPGFTSGGIGAEGSQPWMPLARRVCLDRVLRVTLEATRRFASVRPEGSNGNLYKVSVR